MRILSITAGAAGMYCGSCLRDNALAAELIRLGHQVLLVPLYTPTRTDEPNVSQRRVFFGGISVYLEQHWPLFRHTPFALDRLWDSAAALQLASRRSIPVNPRLLGEMTVSMLKGEDGFQRKELSKLLAWLEKEAAFDVVSLHDSMLLALARPLRRALGCPLVCTLQGEDLFLGNLPEPRRSEAIGLIRANLEFADAFVAVSGYYAEFMTAFLGIPREKVHVVPLGIHTDGFGARDERPSGPFTIGYFGRVAPEKGLHVLCDAYRRLRARGGLAPMRLEAAGYLGGEHRGYLRGIERGMQEAGLAAEFHYRGELDRAAKIRFLQGLDVLSAPCTVDEPKGMFALEAMACGVPVVQPRRGSFPEMIEKTGGGLLVEPENPEALADALASLQKDPERARELGRRGAAGVREHYTAERMARRAMEVYDSVNSAAAAARGGGARGGRARGGRAQGGPARS